MKSLYLLAAVAALITSQAHAQTFDLAITVDDMPAHGSLPKGDTRTGITKAFLAAFKAHKVPEAYGFVNAKRIDEEPDSAETLDLWRAAGYPLGNHTWSHMNIDQGGLNAFIDDLQKGEPAISERMKGEGWPKNWKVLRFPYLAASAKPETHAGIMAWLKTHDYRIADVSISFNDWAYTETYARCVAKADAAAIDAMKLKYMRGVKASIAHANAASRAVYGRQIPLVLLIHEGAFTAMMLPQVLDTFTAAGARYVTLAQAQSDSAYAATDAQAGNGTLIERTAAEKGISLSQVPADEPIADLDAICK